MSEFIEFECETIKTDSDTDLEDQEEYENDFIGDKTVDDQPSFYRGIRISNDIENFSDSVYSSCSNATHPYQECLYYYVERKESVSEFSNFDVGSGFSREIDETKICESRILKFEKSLRQKVEKSEHSFFNALVWAIYFKLSPNQNIDSSFVYDDEKLKEVFGNEFYQKLIDIRQNVVLDINMDTFETKMHLVNDILFEKKFFLRLHEKKNKFRYIIKKGHDGNSLLTEVSSCIELRFNGFNITKHMSKKDQQIEFEAIDIVYKPVKRSEEKIERSFSNEMHLAFIACFKQYKNDKIRSTSAFCCYCCNNFCTSKNVFEKHLKICSKKPVIVYCFQILFKIIASLLLKMISD